MVVLAGGFKFFVPLSNAWWWWCSGGGVLVIVIIVVVVFVVVVFVVVVFVQLWVLWRLSLKDDVCPQDVLHSTLHFRALMQGTAQ